MHVDAELSKDLRLLAVADLEAGVVGKHAEVEAGKLRSAKVRARAAAPVPSRSGRGRSRSAWPR